MPANRTNTSIFQPANTTAAAITFVNADGTTAKQVAAGGSNDSLLRTIMLASSDTSDLIVQLFLNVGATDFLLDTVKVVAGAGTDGITPSVNGMANGAFRLDVGGSKFLDLPTGALLRAAVVTAVTAAKTLTITTTQQNY